MNKTSRNTLTAIAPNVMEFRSLPKKTQQDIFPLLGKLTQTTIELLNLIEESEDEEMTYEDLAQQMGQNPQTIAQKLNALVEGGYPLKLDERVVIAVTGRPRRTAKLT